MVNASRPRSGGRSDGRIRDYFKAFAAPPGSSHSPSPAPPKRPVARGADIMPQVGASDRRRSGSPESEEPTLPALPKQSTQRGSGPRPVTISSGAAQLSSELSSLSSSTPAISDASVADPSLGPSVSAAEQASAGNDGSFRESNSRSSQRVTKGGLKMVLDSSDEGSDVLEDADALLASFQGRAPARAVSPPSAGPAAAPRGRGNKAGHALRSTKPGGAPQRGLAAVPKYKNSLATLVARKEAADAEEAAYQRALQQVAESERWAAAQKERARDIGSGNLDSSALLLLLQGRDREEVEGLMRAVERTEALQRQTAWFFFESRAPVRPPPPPFPAQGADLPEPLLEKAGPRSLALASGHVADLTARQGLSPGLVSWLVATAVSAERPDLRDAALHAVEAADDLLKGVLTTDAVVELFRAIGASVEATADNPQPPIRPVLLKSGGDPASGDMTPLRQVLDIISSNAQWMEAPALRRALLILLTLAADPTMSLEPTVSLALEESLAALITALSGVGSDSGPLRDSLLHIRIKVADPQLRLQIVKAMPCDTDQTCAARQSLARLFVFEDPLPDGPDLLAVTGHVTGAPLFKITTRTDYLALAAKVAMLDIALGDGRGGSDGNTRVTSFDLDDREQVRTFNRQVDDLADTVQGLMTRIVDTGAVHMARTDAKQALQVLHARLEYSVRTRPKPKQSIFGDLDDQDSGAERMKRFLNGRKDTPAGDDSRSG